MKKYIPVALIALLAGTQMVATAQPARDHDHAQQVAKDAGYADAQAMRDDMQKKLSSAKTDAERQQIMKDQKKKMESINGTRGHMHAQMGDHARGDMQKRRQLMQEQMSK